MFSHSVSASADLKPEFDYAHPSVDNFVTRFQTNLRGFFSHALSRSGRYVPRMSSILKKEGLPPELAYLPLIESGFRPRAVSHAGAVGPWQLIRGTGRRYGLRIDRYVDERRDPVKSTEAAAHYLKDLYAQFGDWHLSLAAYNTGEGTISRILQHSSADNFWKMSSRGYLQRETENFVPEFLAALQIAEAPQAYGFNPPTEEMVRYDNVKVDRQLSLSTVARLTGTTTATLRALNPALRRNVLPPHGYTLHLPSGTKRTFEVALAHLARPRTRHHGHHASHRVARRPARTHRTYAARRYRSHRVRRGETVASIARAHNVSVRTLLRINHIRHPRSLQAGRILQVPVAARHHRTPVLAASGGTAQTLD